MKRRQLTKGFQGFKRTGGRLIHKGVEVPVRTKVSDQERPIMMDLSIWTIVYLTILTRPSLDSGHSGTLDSFSEWVPSLVRKTRGCGPRYVQERRERGQDCVREGSEVRDVTVVKMETRRGSITGLIYWRLRELSINGSH